MGHDGNNAIVSNIHDRNLPDLGLSIGLRIVAVHGTNVEGWPHGTILKKITNMKTLSMPFFLTFKKVKFILTNV